MSHGESYKQNLKLKTWSLFQTGCEHPESTVRQIVIDALYKCANQLINESILEDETLILPFLQILIDIAWNDEVSQSDCEKI